MAAVVRGFQNWQNLSKIATTYPWDDWFDGQQWRLTEDDLASVPFDDLARYAHKKAARFGIEVKCKRIEYDNTAKKYTAMIMEATCPMCEAIHSDLAHLGETKDCFLDGFSPAFNTKEVKRRRREYLAGVATGFGYKTVDEVHGKAGKNA